MSENRGNTKMCSVLFVDIVGYSKKTNSEQIALKERFVSLWGQATKEVPSGDVMVVDAGDGAAMTSLVEHEDTIRVAMRLRELLQLEEEKAGEPLPLRIGINFGPVQLSTDVHGKPCIVGDAINIAQRVMSFADPGQIMVSRSYYDVILPLSHKYEEMFYYLGKRADKHIRYHDVYGLGAPNQSAPLGQATAEGMMHVSEVGEEEVKQEPDASSTSPAAQPAMAVKPSVTANAVSQPVKRRSSLLGRFFSWLLSLFTDIFLIVKLALLVLVIYELVVLVPVIKQPGQVAAEINSQLQAVKETWAGILMLEGTVKREVNGQESQPADSAASQPAESAAGTHANKAGTGKIKSTHN